MPRRPAQSAYILAYTLRQVWRANENRYYACVEGNKKLRELNVELIRLGAAPLPLNPEDKTLFWGSIIRELKGMKEASEALAMVTDNDYRSIIFDAIRSPWARVRKSVGFSNLVPELNTLRRYGPIDENQPMGLDEESARDLADLIWAQEMEPFKETGLDPINKQIIANKVARELKAENVKYLGEEIVSVMFNDTELDIWEADNTEAIEMLRSGVSQVFDLFQYDENETDSRNIRNVTQAIIMYNSIFEKEMDDEEVDTLVEQLINVFKIFVHLIT